MWNTSIGWRMIEPGPAAGLDDLQRRVGREARATIYGISRDAQDAFAAAQPPARRRTAWADGVYDGEIVQVPGAELARDEGIRDDTTLEELARL